MKTYRIYFYLIVSFISLVSCSETDILEENPQDFLTTSNAYRTPSDIESATITLYDNVRRFYSNVSDTEQMDLFFGTDAGYPARDYETNALSNYTNLNSTLGFVLDRWEQCYKIILNANAIIERTEAIEYQDENNKLEHLAQARFFRAWAYRTLAHLYGDVPLILEETSEPKRDYERIPRQDIYSQCVIDLQYAIENLNTITEVEDGRLSKAAAYQLLSEIFLSLEQYQNAVDATTWIIDNPNFSLMTERFGSRMDEPGDVYWDLFRLNNQNRASGNTEGIWVLQVDYNTPGGWGLPTGTEANRWERILGPQYNRFRTVNEELAFIGETTYHGGRGQGFFRPTPLFTHTAWKGNEENDIRNSNSNILRKWWIDNPDSEFYNDTLDFTKPASEWLKYFRPNTIESDTNTFIYPYTLKYAMVNNHFESELLDGGPLMNFGARRHYVDNYAMRLAETYLLRAEAYVGLGNLQSAAEDINVVRERSNASPVLSEDVSIDYILDERIRELFIEEQRRITLARLDMVYERTMRYNKYAAPYIQPFNNLYPIPFNEIERNTLAPLEQNPGYD